MPLSSLAGHAGHYADADSQILRRHFIFTPLAPLCRHFDVFRLAADIAIAVIDISPHYYFRLMLTPPILMPLIFRHYAPLSISPPLPLQLALRRLFRLAAYTFFHFADAIDGAYAIDLPRAFDAMICHMRRASAGVFRCRRCRAPFAAAFISVRFHYALPISSFSLISSLTILITDSIIEPPMTPYAADAAICHC
jgi:hypothetical protein